MMVSSPGFRAKFQKRVTSVDFQSNLRKQIRKLPKFLKFVKIIQFYSILFTGVLNQQLPWSSGVGLRVREALGRRSARQRVPVAVDYKTLGM